MRHRSAVAAACLLLFLSLPALAGNECAVRNLSANDVQIGEPVTIQWVTSGEVSSVTVSGHDFASPVTLPATQTSFTYTPDMPGEKHVTVTVSGACGTAAATTKYHVRQCTIDPPVLAVDQTSVEPGDVINATVALPPGHTARWDVQNGTASATTGSAISITAGAPGTVQVTVYVSRGASCTVSATAAIEVKNPCTIVTPSLELPASATAGQSVSAFLDPFPAGGETVTWSVTGGRIVFSDNFSAFIFSNAGATSLTVTATIANASCSVVVTKTMPLIPCLASATVTAGPNPTCDNATVIATFTGTPPFRGTWNDGVAFNTMETTLVRKVARPGNYRIVSMFDATCRGTVSGVASVQFAQPSATWTVGCGIARIHFTGTAPYTITATFSPFSSAPVTEVITTSEPVYDYVIRGNEGGWLNFSNMRDASCLGTVSPFFSQFVQPAPRATAESQFSCGTNAQGGWVSVYVHNAPNEAAPFTVTWDDGEVTTGYWPVYRYVDPFVKKTYTITSITSALCGPIALPEVTSFTYEPTPQPVAMFDDFKLYYCPGETAAASIANTLPDTAELWWSVQNGTITSGQGTRHIELTIGDQPGDVIVTAEARYPNGCVGRSDDTYATGIVLGAPAAALTVEPVRIRAGETATITLTRNPSVASVSISSSLGDAIEFVTATENTTTYLYRSTKGPGQAIITASGAGQCGGWYEVSTSLSIDP